MKQITTLLFSVFLIAPSYADESAVKLCKKHLTSILSFDLNELETTYGEKIHLMPGHEFTKTEYKLGEEGARKTGLTVTRDDLLKAMKEDMGDRAPRPKEMVKKKLSSLEYVLLSNKSGEFITESSDPVETPDGKLHFLLKEGDVLYKAKPPKGDFLLLHLRKADGEWVVVSEYLD